MATRTAFSIADIVEQLRKEVAADEQLEIDLHARLRRSRRALKALAPIAVKSKPAKALRVVKGSLEDRILEQCAEPQPLKAIVASANALPQDVKKAIGTLRAAGRLELSGGAQNSRYQTKG